MIAKKRILFFIQQSFFDPGSGAAVSSKHFAIILAKMGYEVLCLSTTATEHHASTIEHEAFLKKLGWKEASDFKAQCKQLDHSELSFFFVPASGASATKIERNYCEIAEDIIRSHKPSFVWTFGDMTAERHIRKFASDRGAKIIYTLHNEAYRKTSLSFVDHYITPSQDLANRYKKLTRKYTVIAPPILPEEVLAPKGDRLFLTFVNPVPPKGLMLFIRLVEYFGKHRPDIPLLVVEGRASHGLIFEAAKNADIDVSKFENLFVSKEPMTPAQIYQHTKVAIMPSVARESAGRVAMEAMYNGIPAIVSDRGGLPEVVGDAGVVLPLPDGLKPTSKLAVSMSDIQPWINEIINLFDSDYSYQNASKRCVKFAQKHYSIDTTVTRLKTVLSGLA